MSNEDQPNEVYIAANGIGKSVKLQEKYNEYLDNKKNNVIFIKFSEKVNAPDSNIISKNNQMLKEFQSFLEKLFDHKEEIEYSKLQNIISEDFTKKWNYICDNSKLEKTWNKMLEDKNLDFLKNKKIKTIISSEKKPKKPDIKNIPDDLKFTVEKKLYNFNFDSWKTTTKKDIDIYGTGKLVYFQIKFIYSHLHLIDEVKEFKNILIIDEPEIFLHPSLIKKIGFMLKQISKQMNIIVSTHSATFLNSFYDYKKTQIFSKKQFNDEWSPIKISKPSVFTSRQQCFEALMSKKIIIVEGGNDYKLLEYILNNNEVEDNFYICIANGKDTIMSMFHIFNKITYNKNKKYYDEKQDIFILFDKDGDKDWTKNNGKLNEKDHKKINKQIEQQKLNYGFDHNLEKYFNIKQKNEWDPDSFFQEEENKKILKKFLQESKLSDFLK